MKITKAEYFILHCILISALVFIACCLMFIFVTNEPYFNSVVNTMLYSGFIMIGLWLPLVVIRKFKKHK